MAKAIVHRRFNATDLKKGTSLRIDPHDDARSYPEWVIAAGEAAGAVTRDDKPATGTPAKSGAKGD